VIPKRRCTERIDSENFSIEEEESIVEINLNDSNKKRLSLK
jgi:hypothetical protein